LERLAEVCAGDPTPSPVEFEQQYTAEWLSEVPMARVFKEIAPRMAAVTAVEEEAGPRNEVRVVLERGDSRALRMRCVVDDAPRHRIKFQVITPAMPSSTYRDCTVQRHVDRSIFATWRRRAVVVAVARGWL